MWRGGGARALSSVQHLGGDSVGSGGWQALRSTTAERTTVRNKEHEEHCEEHKEQTGEAIIQAERLSAVQTIPAEHEFEFCLTTSNTLECCTRVLLLTPHHLPSVVRSRVFPSPRVTRRSP